MTGNARVKALILPPALAALLGVACNFYLLGSAPAAPDTAGRAATVSEVRNSVEARAAAQENWTAAVVGATILPGGGVRTLADGSARIDLSEGTIIRLAPGTEFTLNALAASDPLTTLRLIGGKLWVILHGGELKVETPVGVASVRGSYLSAQWDPLTNTAIFTCLEGTCVVTTNGGPVTLSTGQQVRINNVDAPPPTGETISETEVAEWLANNPEATVVVLTPTPQPTVTPTPTSTATPTLTPTATGTGPATPTPTDTLRPVPTATHTFTPSPSSTPPPTITPTEPLPPPALTPTGPPPPTNTPEATATEPRPTRTSEPTLTPTIVVSVDTFIVENVDATVAPTDFTGQCPFTFAFTAVITTNGLGGVVTYHWERSDGAAGETQQVALEAEQNRATVSDSWTLGGLRSKFTGWERVVVQSPNSITSNQANFSLVCQTGG